MPPKSPAESFSGLNMHAQIQHHYAQLLGINTPWKVQQVDLKLKDKCVEIQLGWVWGSYAKCPECQAECPIYDSAPERTWRHLDTMQFETILRARVPRSNCLTHGVKTIAVPWAAPQGRFTLLFERMAIEVLMASASVQSACKWLRIGWESAHEIMRRGVERGLGRRELDGLKHLGIDEKSFKRGQSYITVLTDLEESRVLEVVPERTQAAAERVLEVLSPGQKEMVEAVAMDMWEPFVQAIQAQLPEAEVVHDKYHVSAYLNEAVDQVRRQEHKALQEEGDQTLTGTRQLWLVNPENFTEEQSAQFKKLVKVNLKVGRAWAAKELFTGFWKYKVKGCALNFFKKWYGWVSRSQLEPMKEVARMIQRHLPNLLTYIDHPITNGVTEGLNSKIQSLKAAARGFRNFANYRIRILFFCGRLDTYPL